MRKPGIQERQQIDPGEFKNFLSWFPGFLLNPLPAPRLCVTAVKIRFAVHFAFFVCLPTSNNSITAARVCSTTETFRL